MSSRKEREKEARRTLILDAAARVFSQRSYHAATIDEIAAEAELAKGTLYNYFKDKQSIFEELLHRGHGQFVEAIKSLSVEQKSLEEFIHHAFDQILEKMQEHRYMIRMIMSGGANLSEQECSRILENWRNHREIAVKVMRDALATYNETNQLSEDELSSAARLILGSVRLLFTDCFCGEQTAFPQSEIDNYARLLYRALNVENNT